MEVKNVLNALAYLDKPENRPSMPAYAQAAEEPAEESPVANDAAVYERSAPEKYTPDAKRIQELIDEANRGTELLRQLVEKLLLKQGMTLRQAFGMLDSGHNLTLEVDEATRLRAAEEIGEDGYYGVKQTSQRILDFAKALSGGDPEKIEMLRDAFIKGFQMAEEIWGGKLPEISYETYDAVIKGFDEWKASS